MQSLGLIIEYSGLASPLCEAAGTLRDGRGTIVVGVLGLQIRHVSAGLGRLISIPEYSSVFGLVESITVRGGRGTFPSSGSGSEI